VSPLIRAVIDSHALRHNLSVIRSRANGARIIAVVKANAYGHGLAGTALALGEADALAVARLEEALALRAAGIGARIVLLEGVFSPAELDEAMYERLDLVVHDVAQIELLERSPEAARLPLWLKIDTGMNRLGFAPREFASALARIRNLNAAPQELRLMTHLACANEREDELTRAQLERFRAATRGLGYEVSIANSAAIFGSAEFVDRDLYRRGVARGELVDEDPELLQSLSMSASQLILFHWLKSGMRESAEELTRRILAHAERTLFRPR